MRYFVNNYDVDAIRIDEIESKIEGVIDSFVHWISTLDRKRSRSDDGTLYVGDMGIVFIILTVPKLSNNQKCLVTGFQKSYTVRYELFIPNEIMKC